jgi:hypothetical protein
MGAPGGSQEKYTNRPLKRRWLRPSSRMSTTRHRAGFETGNHSSSPLQGAITRGALHVPQRRTTEGYHKTSEKKRKENERSSRREPRCLGPKPRLCGWKKNRPGRMCRSWGLKNLRRQSEIRTGSLAMTAQVTHSFTTHQHAHSHSHTSCVNVHLSRHDLFNCELVPSRSRTRLRLSHTSRRGNGSPASRAHYTPACTHDYTELLYSLCRTPAPPPGFMVDAHAIGLVDSSIGIAACTTPGHALPAPGFIHNTPTR